MFSFPSFKAWRNSLLLFISVYGFGTVVFIFAFWLFFLTFCILSPWYTTPFLFFLGFGLLMLIAASIWYLLVNFLYSLLLRLLWDKPPLWFRSPQSLKQNLIHLGVAIAATFPIAVIHIINLLFVANLEVLTKIDYRSIYAPDLMLKLSWLWIVTAAYVYQWKHQLTNKRNQRLRNRK